MSGHTLVGCCVHVATLIYYLSHAKDHAIKMPAEHLNSVFVDFNKMELPNRPKIIKNKRGQREVSSSSESESSESESSELESSDSESSESESNE